MYAGLKEYFETLGYDVKSVQDAGLKGAKDKDVVDYARKHDMILVTQDQKTSELAELTNTRCVMVSRALIAKVADMKIREKYST
jgi:predicted nuclease of predicted toxin-antitoxin system